jgi:secreted trypsin-like serine protease
MRNLFISTISILALILSTFEAVAQDKYSISMGKDLSARIIGGTPTMTGAYPFMVALVFDPNNATDLEFGHFCGGTLIAPRTVLTAGHCVEYINEVTLSNREATISVVVGRTDLRDNRQGQVAKVRGSVIHPKYSSSTLKYDLAIIKLDRDINLQQMPLLAPEEESRIVGKNGTVVGWGQTHPTLPIYPFSLHAAEVTLRDQAYCEDTIGRFFSAESMLCAGDLKTQTSTPRDACYGDSGGPLLVTLDDKTQRFGGIVSSGFVCGGDVAPGVYSRVTAGYSWVLSDPPIPPKNISLPTLSKHQTLQPGTQITCNSGLWGGEDLTFKYSFFASGAGDESQARITRSSSPNYQISTNDVGLRIFCEVIAENRSGTITTASDFSQTVEAVAVQVPNITPEAFPQSNQDLSPPTISRKKSLCKKLMCVLQVMVNDDLNISSVSAASFFEGKICRREKNGKRICTNVTSVSTNALTNIGSGIYRLKKKFKGKGRLRVVYTAIDGSGKSAIRREAVDVN